MQILAAELNNFKVHEDAHFEFQVGINAICGENGAGKTSILDAIGWVLFNHNRYSKVDRLVREGCKSAQAAITFVSAKDHRTYRVTRRTRGTTYDIYDPQLGQKLDVSGVSDVQRWLREHLGISSDTDLALPNLFEKIIGIPQGTFTDDFKQKETARRSIFDPLLGVQEYRQTYEKASGLQSYAKSQVDLLERDQQRYAEQLAGLQQQEEEVQALRRQIEADRLQLQTLQGQLQQDQQQRDRWLKLRQDLTTAQQTVQKLAGDLQAKQSNLALVQKSVAEAEAAQAACRTCEPDYQAYCAAELALEQLHQQSVRQKQYLKQREKAQKDLAISQEAINQLAAQLANLAEKHDRLQALQPLADRQTTLEAEQTHLNQAWQALTHLQQEQERGQHDLRQLAQDLAALAQEIDEIVALETRAASLEALEEQCDRLQRQISHIEAAQQFQAELQNLWQTGQTEHQQQVQDWQTLLGKWLALESELRPFSDAVATVWQPLRSLLEDGHNLNQELLRSLQQILTDLASQTDVAALQKSLKAVKADRQKAEQARLRWHELPAKRQKQESLLAQQQQLEQRQQERAQALAQRDALQQQCFAVQQALEDLKNPKAQIVLLQEELSQRSRLQANYDRALANCQPLTAAIQQLDAQLQALSTLDEQIQTQTAIRKHHQVGYESYQHSVVMATTLVKRSQQCQTIAATIEQLASQLQAAESVMQQLAATFDPIAAEQAISRCQEIETRCTELQTKIPLQQQNLLKAEQRLQELQSIAERYRQTEIELQKRQWLRQFIADARDFYNQAGPYITEILLGKITWEADRLFREILHRQSVALRWTDTYEILVQDGSAEWRSFESLSGGEQMSAALAVRLALLKVLANTDVVFFDEPTVNMDQVRRRQFAEALGNLKTLRQIFVISHDDTFESITENIITVKRR